MGMMIMNVFVVMMMITMMMMMIMMIMITQRGARRFPISSSRLTQGGDFDFILHTM